MSKISKMLRRLFRWIGSLFVRREVHHFSGTKKAFDILKSMGKKKFEVLFIKRTTGEARRMACQYGVKKNITGKGMRYDPKNRNLSVVFDLEKDSYRMINVEGLISIKQGSREYINLDQEKQ
jgi:hypothetical protein